MRNYDVIVKFKNGSAIDFKLECDKDLETELQNSWLNPKEMFKIADYFIDPKEVLWVKLGGENTVKINE